MRTHMILAAALCGSLFSVDAALALDTARSYTVRFEGLRVGSWRLRNRVVDVGEACRYTVQWSNLSPSSGGSGAPLARTRRCFLLERKAGDDFDCERSRRRLFDTIVHKAACDPCFGFDDFGQETVIRQLVAGESSEGYLVGVVMSNSVGDVQNLEVTRN